MTASAGPALQELHAQFGDDVRFVTLYVREAHPGDRYPQPETMERKLEHARTYKQRDGIPWTVAVDDVEGSLHRALDPKPDAVYVVDGQGRVFFRQLWANDSPKALRAALAEVGSSPTRARGERVARVRPMTDGLGKMYDILSFSGPKARRDVLKQVPPMYGMARLAAVFRPLSPLGRGVAAMATTMAGVAAGAALARRTK